MWKVQNTTSFGSLGISHFENDCRLQNSDPKAEYHSWCTRSCSHLKGVHLSSGQADQTIVPVSWPSSDASTGGLSDLRNQVNWHPNVQYCIAIHYHSCSFDKYRNMEGPKCHQFWKVINIAVLSRKRFAKLSPKAGRVSSTFLL